MEDSIYVWMVFITNFNEVLGVKKNLKIYCVLA